MGRDIRGFEIKLASPCTVEWSSMSGTERVRFCGLCQKSVYELSGLTRDEVLALLAAKPDVCVTFFQREDGTVLTADCPVGERLARGARRLAWATRAVLASTVGSVVAGFLGIRPDEPVAPLVDSEEEHADCPVASEPRWWDAAPPKLDPNMRGGGARIVHRDDAPTSRQMLLRDLQTRE